MKIVVIGGTGLIGTKLVELLRAAGHEAIAASPRTGVDTVSGRGVTEALAGAEVLVDVSNGPSFEDQAILRFFTSSTDNLLAAAKRAGVRHYLALSVVGADRLPDAGYLRAKVAQEARIEAGGVPYTILRATQFFEFAQAIAAIASAGDVVRLSPARMQPVAAHDVSAALAELAQAAPQGRVLELAGPEPIRMSDFVARVLAARGDRREVVVDAQAGYFGTAIDDDSLVPSGADARHGVTRLEDWLRA